MTTPREGPPVMERTVHEGVEERARDGIYVATYPSGPEAASAARRFVRECVAEQADDVQLIVSELVTNAVRYGTEPGDSIRVVIAPTADSVRIEVHDPVRRWPRLKPPSDERVRGRGLFIVDALAARWGVEERPLGKAVWAEVAR